jgi:poly-gamma-glutamate capsule biosynthesis protein CapA/YwtB (metallophosphatase superfamily)
MKKVILACLLIIVIVGLNVAMTSKKNTTDIQSSALIIGFAGDTMLGRSVSEVLMTMPAAVRSRYPWGNILPILQHNDLNIINLETTLTTSTKMRPKVFNFKADPAIVEALKIANISVVNVANNHILDFDYEGLLETLTVLDDGGIAHVGAGLNAAHARKPVILNKKGIAIGIIGYTDNEPDWRAGIDHPGTNYIKIGSIEQVRMDIKALRNQVDVVVVSIHWGPNKQERPSQEFINFAHAMIDAGVDIIHGHSAHSVQGIEIYNNRLIMYDTGDFVDDYMVYKDLRNDLGFLFEVTLDKNGPLYVSLIPTKIADAQVNRANGADKKHIEERMQMLCAEFGTQISHDNIIHIR